MREQSSGSQWWEGAVVFLIFSIAVVLLLPAAADPDLWGHVRFGLDFLETGSLDQYDPYAYTSGGQEWINHEWISEIAFAAVYQLLGSRGLLLFKFAVSLLIAGLLHRRLRSRGVPILPRGILLILVLLLLNPGVVTVRPQLFTYLFMAVLLLLLEASETRRPRAIWLAPLVIAIWINFHGGVLAGIGILGVWMAGRWLSVLTTPDGEQSQKPRRAAVHGTGAFAAGALALVVNPFGVDLPVFLFRTATVPRLDIVEWFPTPILSFMGGVYMALVVACGWAIFRSEAPKRVAPLLAWTALAILPLSAVRHLPLFAIGVPILLAPHFASAAGSIVSNSSSTRTSSGRLQGSLTATAILVGAIMLLSAAPRVRCVEITEARPIRYPVRAVAWLQQSGVEANLATYFDWGEYALWHLAPRVKISMDGRRETVYPDSVYDEYLRFQNGVGEWDEHIERHPTDLVLFTKDRPAYNLMRLKPGWELLYEDDAAALFAPSGSTVSARLRATPIPEVEVHGIGYCAP